MMTNVIGYDDEISNLIENYKKNNLHSSIIFHGPKGIGKRLLINNLIIEIFKIKFDKNKISHHFNLFINNTHPNIKLIKKEVDKKTKKLNSNITIDQIRSLKKFINSTSSIKNLDKFIIVDCSDDFNLNSTNSFLKTLEEPNSNTFIFLVSHQISTLLPTLRSRCLKIRLKPHSFENFQKIILKIINNLSDDDVKFFYDFTQGSPGNSISLHNDNILDFFKETLNGFSKKGLESHLLNISNSLAKLDNEKFKNYLSILKSILIIILKFKTNNHLKDFYLSDRLNNIKNVSTTLSYQNIIDRLEFLTKYENDLFKFNLDKNLFMQKFLII